MASVIQPLIETSKFSVQKISHLKKVSLPLKLQAENKFRQNKIQSTNPRCHFSSTDKSGGKDDLEDFLKKATVDKSKGSDFFKDAGEGGSKDGGDDEDFLTMAAGAKEEGSSGFDFLKDDVGGNTGTGEAGDDLFADPTTGGGLDLANDFDNFDFKPDAVVDVVEKVELEDEDLHGVIKTRDDEELEAFVRKYARFDSDDNEDEEDPELVQAERDLRAYDRFKKGITDAEELEPEQEREAPLSMAGSLELGGSGGIFDKEDGVPYGKMDELGVEAKGEDEHKPIEGGEFDSKWFEALKGEINHPYDDQEYHLTEPTKCYGGRQAKGAKESTCRLIDLRQLHFTNLPLLSKYTGASGMIEPRKTTGLCARCQRKVAKTIKHSRQTGIMPFVVEPKSSTDYYASGMYKYRDAKTSKTI